MTDKKLFEEFELHFPEEARSILYAADAAETLTYRYMYRAFVFGYKAGQREEVNRQNLEQKDAERK